MDRCRWFHDRRSTCHQFSLCHQRTLVHRGDGALQLRCEGHLSSDNLPGVPQEHPYCHQEYLQPHGKGYAHPQEPKPRRPEDHQGYLVNQRHLSCHHLRSRHGRCDWCEQAHLLSFGRPRHFGLHRFAGIVREHYDHRCEER